MRTGISVYFGSGIEENERTIDRARRSGATLAFTSLHIPEEDGVDYIRDARRMLRSLRDAGIDLIADVGPETCYKLGCAAIEDLVGLGITYVRLDDGFDAQRTVELSRTFHIAFNASTVTAGEIATWRALGADLRRFAACHNYYPKRNTGLDLEDVRRMNDRLAVHGFEILAFVPGDGELRGPLHEGLPTVEAHRVRSGELARNMLELACEAGCDGVLVGDVGLSDASWGSLARLSAGYVDVRCALEPAFSYLAGQIHHDRPDSSRLVFRSQESRRSLKPGFPIEADGLAGAPRPVGSIAVSNTGYLRYEGELEIARVGLAADERMSVVGQVHDDDLALLPLIKNGFGLRLV
ncbi:MupG family TIM beta-alpha barrel fold protein [Collinsella vaginalis]|uniref:MupG family TIM beta-alpha barrel fold protein n=1 Tax=Collinsella vaginalis TaxID=1870987 RepID=UPI000A27117F|nr:MupG family TIM beta-alpha barrel fold protein [Collinsella vaginalis]